MTSEPNAIQREYWNTRRAWVDYQDQMDRQLDAFGRAAIEALGPLEGRRVLDVGCGCGHTTMQLADAGAGAVLGLDISEPMVAVAQRRVAEGGYDDVRIEVADVQTASLAGSFDAVASRFGVMFFADPVEAFANLHSATVPGSPLGFVCWQPVSENPWMTVPNRAAMTVIDFAPRGENAADPFAFGDPEWVESVLTTAGWSSVEATSVVRPVSLAGGGDVDDAVDLMIELGPSKAALEGRDAATHERVRNAMREALTPHVGDDGAVSLPGATWVVTARA